MRIRPGDRGGHTISLHAQSTFLGMSHYTTVKCVAAPFFWSFITTYHLRILH